MSHPEPLGLGRATMARMRGLGMLALGLALVGCGASTPARVETAPPDDDECGSRATHIAGSCWSPEGTRWAVVVDGSAGLDDFEIELLAAGRVRSNDSPDASPASDEWFLDGAVLRVFLSDRFVEYRATVTNGTVLVGEATNVRGQRWPWRGERLFGERSCAEGEARLESACMTVAGTRWQIEGEPRVVELLRDGVVASSPADPGADRWTQEGTRIAFTVDEGARRLEGTLEGDARIRGSDFSATRVESIAP